MMKRLAMLLAVAALAVTGGVSTADAASPQQGHALVESVDTSAGPVLGLFPIDDGGGGLTFLAGPVWMNGPYGYGRYCWYWNPYYGHLVLPC